MLGLDDLTLESIVLILSELSAFKLLLGLLLCFLQGLQLFTGGGDGVLQEFLFLGQQFGVAGIQFQQALNVLEFTLRCFDCAVYTL